MPAFEFKVGCWITFTIVVSFSVQYSVRRFSARKIPIFSVKDSYRSAVPRRDVSSQNANGTALFFEKQSQSVVSSVIYYSSCVRLFGLFSWNYFEISFSFVVYDTVLQEPRNPPITKMQFSLFFLGLVSAHLSAQALPGVPSADPADPCPSQASLTDPSQADAARQNFWTPKGPPGLFPPRGASPAPGPTTQSKTQWAATKTTARSVVVAPRGGGGYQAKVSTTEQPEAKTALCRYFQQYGRCQKGVHCKFAHGDKERQNKLAQQQFKTSLCQFWLRGACARGAGVECPYAHGRHELRDKPDRACAGPRTPRTPRQAGPGLP